MCRVPRFHAAFAVGIAAWATGCSYDFVGALHCTNGVTDFGEVDVDCGGECPACALGKLCRSDADCAEGTCESGRCTAPEIPDAGSDEDSGPPPIGATHVAWIPIPTTGGMPEGRLGAALAYQGRTRGTIMRFGGYSDTTQGDAWLLDGDVWIDGDEGPTARHYAAMVHDPGSDRTLLVGGVGGSTTFGDAWWWSDGWSAGPTPPWSRLGHKMVLDTDRDKMIVFGGDQSAPTPGGLQQDTWELDLATETWAEITTDGAPPGRVYAAMAYDSERKRVVLFGGGPPNSELGDTWEYDPAATKWTEITQGIKPQSRYGAAMTFDEQRKAAVMYGGRTDTPVPDTYNETWELDGDGWRLVDVPPLAAGPKRFQASMVHDSGRRRTILVGGATSFSKTLADVWAYVVVGMPCRAADECASGACTDGVCCTVDACPNGEVCNGFDSSGTCAPR